MSRSERFTVISTYLIFILFSMMMPAAVRIYSWDYLPTAVVIAEAAALAAVLITGKFKIKTCGGLLTLFGIADIWIYLLYSGNYYDTLVLSAGLTVLTAFYNSFFCIFAMMLSTLTMQSCSVIMFGFAEASDSEEMLRMLAGTVCVTASQVLLAAYINIRRAYDEKMRRSIENAHEAERAKSDFLANMSHEIRTPMNAIIGLCELILRDEKNLSESAVEKCVSIRTSGRNLLAIINDILDFSKIESGNMVLSEAPYNISGVVNDVISISSAGANGRKLEIIADIDPSVPSGLIGDELRIRQIITNLMSNAVKFTSKGTVVLRVSQRKTDYGINLRVSVTDTGIGITPEDLEKLFVSFQQVDTKKNRSVEGTGLGLAISKRFVRMMGGFINVKSEYGKGSEFSFVIPQKVSDPTPFARVEDPSQFRCACCIRFDKYPDRTTAFAYHGLINNMSAGLGIVTDVYENLFSVRQAAACIKYTHFFIAREEYLEDKRFFEKLSERADVILIQNRAGAIIPGGRIRIMYKPFFVKTVISALKNEKLIESVNESNSFTGMITAPGAKVLIVDDNEINLRVSAGLMKPYKVQISTASGGREAIEMLRSKDFHIVFMDHMMPGMDGVEATNIIRSDPDIYFKNLPIIALTANAVGSARDMFIKAGFDDYLSKPIELSALDRIMRKYIPSGLVNEIKSGRDTQKVKAVPVQAENDWFCSADGIKLTGNDPEAYLDILKVYLKNGLLKIDEIQRLYENKNWKNYIIEVHALKSSSKSIGAELLSDKAREIEEAGKAGDIDTVMRCHGEMISGYRIVLAHADSYISSHGGRSSGTNLSYTEMTEKKLAVCIRDLITALEDFDSDKAMEIIRGLDGFTCMGIPVSVMLKEVRSITEDYDYSRAAETARQLPVYRRCGGDAL